MRFSLTLLSLSVVALAACQTKRAAPDPAPQPKVSTGIIYVGGMTRMKSGAI